MCLCVDWGGHRVSDQRFDGVIKAQGEGCCHFNLPYHHLASRFPAALKACKDFTQPQIFTLTPTWRSNTCSFVLTLYVYITMCRSYLPL